ncbi:hypothetical protein [Moorena sp. SIO4G3]|nr:hypothetical protein [Moorena sp. SIO4G3]NEO76898.1 hypothetical protein [Moorena sp. SIO4G3]
MGGTPMSDCIKTRYGGAHRNLGHRPNTLMENCPLPFLAPAWLGKAAL